MGEFHDGGAGLRRCAHAVHIRVEPGLEGLGPAGVVEVENRRALHIALHNRGLDPARLGQDAHAPIIARHQGAFGGRQRDIDVFILDMLTAHP
jgi:hypothetical protein